jgi:hypothetical protein
MARTPADITRDPCASLPATLVPRAKPARGLGRTEGYRTVEWKCGIESAGGASPRASLDIEVTRVGTGYRTTALESARQDFRGQRGAQLATMNAYPGRGAAEVTGLGDEAFAVAAGDYAVLLVRRGTDLVEVRYFADPSTRDRILAAAVAVARTVLAGMPER